VSAFTQEIAGYQEHRLLIGHAVRKYVKVSHVYIETVPSTTRCSVHTSSTCARWCALVSTAVIAFSASVPGTICISHPYWFRRTYGRRLPPYLVYGSIVLAAVRSLRVIFRCENETINETWIPDRDRFSYEGVYSPDLYPISR